jgi:hypothetical protein
LRSASAARKDKAREILRLETRSRELSDLIVQEGAAGRGNGRVARRHLAELNTCVQEISDLFVEVFETTSAAALPAPEYEFQMDRGRAKRAEVRFLSANRPVGSRPQASPLGWAEIAAHGFSNRGDFVQMHLINARLGGHGNAANLVPGSRGNNSAHLAAVETPIKNLVGHEPLDRDAIRDGNVLHYQIEVSYRSGTNRFTRAPLPQIEHYAESMTFTYKKYTHNPRAGGDPRNQYSGPFTSRVVVPIGIDLPPFR